MLRSVVKVYRRNLEVYDDFVGFLQTDDTGKVFVSLEPGNKDVTIDQIQNLPDHVEATELQFDIELLPRTELSFVPAFIVADDTEVSCA